MPEKKLVTLHIRVPESVAKALKDLAEADARKVSPYAALVLTRHVDAAARKGRPPKKG